jgi:hypothetical protein
VNPNTPLLLDVMDFSSNEHPLGHRIKSPIWHGDEVPRQAWVRERMPTALEKVL